MNSYQRAKREHIRTCRLERWLDAHMDRTNEERCEACGSQETAFVAQYSVRPRRRSLYLGGSVIRCWSCAPLTDEERKRADELLARFMSGDRI